VRLELRQLLLLLGEVRVEGVDVGAEEEDGEVEEASGSGLRMRTTTMSANDIAREAFPH
jgi:hypothetical protein